ncbi:MAG: RluA family pseudouridine synthase [Acidobacteriota bacterium]
MHSLLAGPKDVGKRLDHFLQEKLPEYSRSRLQSWIKDGRVTVSEAVATSPSTVLRSGEAVELQPSDPPPLKAVPEDLPVEVLYEDASVIAINKPAGVVVHAGAGNHEGTLVNRLVHHFGKLSEVAGELRPGIVHRLDKDTSGVLLVARTDAAHRALSAQFADRTVEKMYLALVHGHVREESGRITKRIGRDPKHRTRMVAGISTGRTALTEYTVRERFGEPTEDDVVRKASQKKTTFLEVRIGTGRTHQIRVHLANMGHPVAGDSTYGKPYAAAPTRRMFLHAWRISFDSPATGERVMVEAPLPDDLSDWLGEL